jgi:hypothetical protein
MRFAVVVGLSTCMRLVVGSAGAGRPTSVWRSGGLLISKPLKFHKSGRFHAFPRSERRHSTRETLNKGPALCWSRFFDAGRHFSVGFQASFWPVLGPCTGFTRSIGCFRTHHPLAGISTAARAPDWPALSPVRAPQPRRGAAVDTLRKGHVHPEDAKGPCQLGKPPEIGRNWCLASPERSPHHVQNPFQPRAVGTQPQCLALR